MHSKPRRRTAERLSYRRSWKICSTARTKARMLPPFLQPFCELRSRFEISRSEDHCGRACDCSASAGAYGDRYTNMKTTTKPTMSTTLPGGTFKLADDLVLT